MYVMGAVELTLVPSLCHSLTAFNNQLIGRQVVAGKETADGVDESMSFRQTISTDLAHE